MKYTKTTLRELSHKYATVLKKCALLNMGILLVSTSVSASTNPDISINGTDVSGTYADLTKITNDSGKLSLTNNSISLGATGRIDVQNADLTLQNASLDLSSDSGEVYNANASFSNTNLSATNSEIYVDGNLSFSGGEVNINYSDKSNYSEVEAYNLTLDNASMTITDSTTTGDTTVAAKNNLTIQNGSQVTLNENAILAWNGQVYQEGENGNNVVSTITGQVAINSSTVDLKDKSKLLIGAPDDEGADNNQASLTMSGSTMNLYDSSAVEFYANNFANTTFYNTTVNANNNSSITLNALNLTGTSTIFVNDNAVLNLDSVTGNGAIITGGTSVNTPKVKLMTALLSNTDNEDVNQNRTQINIKDTELTGNQEFTFKNATVAITESDLETNGDITIENANLKVSCIDCYSAEEGEEDFSHMVMGENVTIKNSNITLGDTSRLSETQKDYAYLGGNADFIIGDDSSNTIDTTVTLNGNSVLAYEGTIADNGSGSVQIYNTHLTLNNNSSLLLGTPPDDADENESEQESGNASAQTLSSTSDETTPTVSAPLTIKNSIIDLNGDSKVEFLVLNADNTTISNTTINMNQQDDSTASASMTLNDVTIENNSVINMASASSITAKNVTLDGSSIHMKDGAVLNVYDVIYNDGLISVDGNNAKIMLNKKTDVANGESTVNTLTLRGTKVNTSILSDDVGNIVNFLGDVVFAGLFDPATANVGDGTTETVLTKKAYDDAITYNLNAKGTLKYTDDKYLYDNTKHTGTYAKNSVVFKGGALDLQNNTATAIKLASVALESDSNIFVDADLANKTMDTVSADNVTGEAKLNVAGINLLSDATENKTTINFADDKLKGQVAYTGEQELTALSPIYKYTVAYDDQTGDFEFTRQGGTEQGGTGQSSANYNPAVYSTSTVGQSIGLLQSAISGVAFNEMGGISGIGRSGGDTPTMANAWVKMVGFDDNVDFDSFQTVEADTTSVLAGVNTAVIKAGSIDTQYGLYAGYLNGKQEYEGNEIDQDGGYIGLTSLLQKGNLFAQGTLNGGFVHNKASHSFGADKYNSFFSGVGLKTGYNWTIGGVQITPSIYGGYTFVRTEDYTSKSGANIENDHLKVWELTPALKVSKDFNDGWNGFAQVKYTFVGDNKADVSANDIVLPNISLKDYVEYGIGASRGLSDDWTASFTLNRRDGGRQGWNGSVSLEYNF